MRVGTLTVKAKKGNGVVRFRGRFGRKLLAPRELPAGRHGQDAKCEVPAQARDLQGGEGMSGEDTPRARRRFRRVAGTLEDDGRPAAGDPLDSVHAELVLLREENARLKAAQHRRADVGRLLDRARSLPAAAADSGGASDDTAQLLFDGLVIRESLLEICREIERAMVAFEAKLDALATAAVDRPSAASVRARQALGMARRPSDRQAPVPLGLVRPRVLLTTEGTYPYAMGGVSSWCDLLVKSLTGFDWQVLPIVAPDGRPPTFELPEHAREVGRIEVWSEELPKGGRPRRSARRVGEALPAVLARHLVGWEGDVDAVVAAWTWCRRHPAGVRRVFRSDRGWAAFLGALREVLAERVPEAGTPPALDLVEAARLYQTLYWVARTAAAPTPDTDVLHVTAAGWSAIPAVVHKALHGTPMVLTEHGVYVREAYLAAARNGDSPGTRFAATRLARGLARVAYEAADVVAPVTDANAHWEMGLGIDPAKILVLHNGLRPPAEPTLAPRTRTVVSVGRVDPLKDVHTMLRVAAQALAFVPDARFEHYGPVPSGEEAYGRSCLALHDRLGLRERFRFRGPTGDPDARRPLGRRRAHDEHLRGAADVDPRGDGPGPAGRRDGRRRRARRRARLRRGVRAGRRPRAGHGRRPAPAQPRARLAAGPARAPPAEAHLHRVGLHRRLSRPAAGRGRAGRRAARPDRAWRHDRRSARTGRR